MKKITLFFCALAMTALVANSYSQNIKEVKIGSQVWMAENLNVNEFRNGDPIPMARTATEWEYANENKLPAWCYYNNEAANGQAYGKLYNWYAVHDPRGLASKGWHVPSDQEWTQLTDHLGPTAGAKMKSNNGWKEKGNGTNESGFSGLSGGGRYSDGKFDGFGGYGVWWSSTENDYGSAWNRSLNSLTSNVNGNFANKGNGVSVRCVKDAK